jgi:hypothetical protein
MNHLIHAIHYAVIGLHSFSISSQKPSELRYTEQRILMLDETVLGGRHDDSMLKEKFDSKTDGFATTANREDQSVKFRRIDPRHPASVDDLAEVMRKSRVTLGSGQEGERC